MWEQIAANRRKSFLLVLTAALLLAALGWAGGEYFLGKGGGTGGVLIALLVWGVMTLTAWFQGDNVMLSVAGAHRVEKEDLPHAVQRRRGDDAGVRPAEDAGGLRHRRPRAQRVRHRPPRRKRRGGGDQRPAAHASTATNCRA